MESQLLQGTKNVKERLNKFRAIIYKVLCGLPCIYKITILNSAHQKKHFEIAIPKLRRKKSVKSDIARVFKSSIFYPS